MAKIGIIYCSYGMPDYLSKSLSPWIEAKKINLGGNEFLIAAVSTPFKEYKDYQILDNSTPTFLSVALAEGDIDDLYAETEYLLESEVRDKALQFLLKEDCDSILIADGDEFFTREQIERLLKFTDLDPWTSWFKFSYKNYIFDSNHYLAEPFTPPRFFRVLTNGYRLDTFSWDNDVFYKGTITSNGKFVNKNLDYKELPSRTIPVNIAFIKHYTWFSDQRSKNKIRYQMEHFKGSCSYRWNEKENKLEFNPEYYNQIGQRNPEVLEDV